jgi:1,4-dihydroxy-2-naphthoyl-CoA hydrolase
MTIWKRPISLDLLQAIDGENAVTHLGIEYLGFGDDYLTGRVPVDKRTIQPYGLIHGGVSVVLAETLGSVAANFAAPFDQQWVGLDINANHLRGVSSGWVTGTCRAVHIGKTTQVWHIDMRNDAGELSCVSRITMAVLRSRPHLSLVGSTPRP